MTLVVQEVLFQGRAPEPARISEAITRLCGLPVALREARLDPEGGLYDLHAKVAFAADEQNSIEIYSYRPGAVREHHQQVTAGAPPLLGRQLRRMQGLDEPEGSQAVHLR